MNKSKAIFLDVGGVLNTYDILREQGDMGLGEIQLQNLKRIVDATDATIVLTTTLRLLDRIRNELRRRLWHSHGIKVMDWTDDLGEGCRRADEIQAWLNQNPVDKYAILGEISALKSQMSERDIAEARDRTSAFI